MQARPREGWKQKEEEEEEEEEESKREENAIRHFGGICSQRRL